MCCHHARHLLGVEEGGGTDNSVHKEVIGILSLLYDHQWVALTTSWRSCGNEIMIGLIHCSQLHN